MGTIDMEPVRSASPPRHQSKPQGLWFKRLGWLVLIWVLSVGALGIAAGLMRLFMHLLGMK